MGEDYPAVFPGPNYPPLNTKFSPNEWVNDWVAKWKKVGGDTCVGRCGIGCPSQVDLPCGAYRYTRDCLNHDACGDEYGSRFDQRCDRIADNAGDDCLLAFDCAGIHYVDKDGECLVFNKVPCYGTIQVAIDAAASGSIIKIREVSYGGTITLNASIPLIIQAVWN